MEKWHIILFVIGGYFLLLILYSLLVYFMVQKTIGKRTDKNPLLRYFTASDYPGLKSEDFSFLNPDGVKLNGKIYTRGEESETIALFFHGFGAGHESYTTLINDLVTTLKMPVLAFDYTGCDLSEGKKIPNTLQAVVDADAFLKHLQTMPAYKDKKLILIGHSWGGFVATNLLPFHPDKKITQVISLNGVTDFPLMYKYQARAPYLFIPVNNLINLFRYKKFALTTTRKSIKNTKVSHLFIHGLKDEAVPFSPFISSLVLPEDKYHNINFHFEKDRYHNAYLTNESETNLRELQADLKSLVKAKDKDSLINKIKATDFNKLVENDPSILTIIKTFVEGSNEKR